MLMLSQFSTKLLSITIFLFTNLFKLASYSLFFNCIVWLSCFRNIIVTHISSFTKSVKSFNIIYFLSLIILNIFQYWFNSLSFYFRIKRIIIFSFFWSFRICKLFLYWRLATWLTPFCLRATFYLCNSGFTTNWWLGF
jgi:hypothetical protein